MVDKEKAELIHRDTGYKYYNFSNIITPNVEICNIGNKKGIQFKNGYFYITSPDSDFIKWFAEGLLLNPVFHLGKAEMTFESISIEPSPFFKSPIIFKTISPVYVKTMRDTTGGPMEWDLYPNEGKFWENIHLNLLERFYRFYCREPESSHFEIVKVIGSFKPKRIRVKNAMRRCSLFTCEVHGSKDLLKFAYDSGLGEKTAMGFGCVKVLSEEEIDNLIIK
ncbi:MAG: CRISPR-associated endoribonuclease Cas6 [Thermoplasmata archaeon]